jgi:hypothetical protein
MHYQGPAVIIGSIEGRKRQYVFEYNGKRYKRHISMLIPEQTMLTIDVTTLDVTDSRESGAKPKLHINGAELHEEDLILCKTDLTDTKWYLTEINKIYSNELHEEDLILCKTDLTDTKWYLTEINKIYSDEVEIIYFTTPIKEVENYIEQSMEQRSENLRSARF